MRAYKTAAQRAVEAAAGGNSELAQFAEEQMSAIRELEQARKEIFSRHGVTDLDLPEEHPEDSPNVEEVNYNNLPFNWLLVKLRQEAELTQDDLAEKVGLTQSSISAYEHGGTIPPPKRLKN